MSIPERLSCLVSGEHRFTIMPAQGMFTVVSALEVETDEDSDEASEEEDNNHYYPAVVLIYPV